MKTKLSKNKDTPLQKYPKIVIYMQVKTPPINAAIRLRR